MIILRVLSWWFRFLRWLDSIFKRKPGAHFDLVVCIYDKKTNHYLWSCHYLKGSSMYVQKLTTEQKVSLTLRPRTSSERLTKVDGVPTWDPIPTSIEESGGISMVVSTDGMSAVFVAGDLPGRQQFRVSADADLGDGVETISEIVSIEVEHAKATSLGFEASEPQPK